MSGPMLRFAVVAVVLLALVVFYAGRLGEAPAGPDDSSDVGEDYVVYEPLGAPPAGSDEEPNEWFPDLSGRNDVPGVTLGTGDARTSFGCDIEEIAESMRLEERLDAYSQQGYLNDYLEALAWSGDAELLVAAAQFGVLSQLSNGGIGGDELAPDAMLRAYQTDPTNPLVLWNAVRSCESGTLSGICSDLSFNASVEAVLGVNGEYWVRVAGQRWADEDPSGAMEAMRRASTAPEFDNYFMENVRAIQRALATVPDTSYIERSIAAYGVSMIQHQATLLQPCIIDDNRNSEMWDLCMGVAERYVADGRTLIQQQVGLGMQAALFRSADMAADAEDVTEQLRELREYRQLLDEDLLAVVLTDDRAVSMFFEQFEAGDEFSAMNLLSAEVERLKQDPEYNPCPDQTTDLN